MPLGLLPGGTGNLLARALGLDVEDAAGAMEIVLGGREEQIDVGVLRADGGEEHVFLVMAGMGLDAEMMGRTDERLKAAVGWVAYLTGGLRALAEGGFGAWVQLAGGPAVRRYARSVVVGNSGRLVGGLDLMPDARLDDGLLDIAVVAPRGVRGWVHALVALASGRRGKRDLDRRQAPVVRVRAAEPTQAQLDGDPIGAFRELEVRVNPGALRVLVPRGDA